MKRTGARLILVLLLGFGHASCAGTQTFTTAARAGDTVALAVGWNKAIARQNITVTITPSSGPIVTYGPNDPNVRAVVNLYPDPVSRLVVGTETQQGLGYNANVHGNSLTTNVTNQDRDWGETVVYLDLPTTLATGTATINITGPDGPVTAQPITVDILPGAGNANPFAGPNGNLTTEQLATLERADAYTITFNSSTIPHAIHLVLNHTSGVGTTWVVNPRGDLKNVVWSDTASAITVMLTPANGLTLQQMIHFKFYIAGGITGLTVASVKAYDINGNLIPDVTASIQ